MIAKGTILKSSGGLLQPWIREALASDPATTPRLFPPLKEDGRSCTDRLYKTERNETCKPPCPGAASQPRIKSRLGLFLL